TEQRRRPVDAARSFHQTRHDAELLVLADHRMFHVDEQSTRLSLLHLYKFASSVDRGHGNAASLAFVVKLFLGVLSAKFRDRLGDNVWMLAAVGHLFELRP